MIEPDSNLMHASKQHIYDALGCRQLDKQVAKELGISGYQLMQKAGGTAAKVIIDLPITFKRVVVITGAGNNGGDGYVIATALLASDYSVRLFAISKAATEETQQAADAFQKAGGSIEHFVPELSDLNDADLIVDAWLGTGVSRQLNGTGIGVIELINQSRTKVVSVDTPSGLSSDTGMPMPVAVYADYTVSFISLKIGMITGLGKDYVGNLVLEHLDAPSTAYTEVAAVAQRLSKTAVRGLLPTLNPCCHKVDQGHAFIAGGYQGMLGAVLLASTAAARSGAGKVTLGTHAAHAAYAALHLPTLMTKVLDDTDINKKCLGAVNAAALGPGLGREAWSVAVFDKLLRYIKQAELPAAIDADGLIRLADHPEKYPNWVLTPHPKEAAVLLDWPIEDVMSDRLAAAKAITDKYSGVCVLKGPGTLIVQKRSADQYDVRVCDAGNPGLASAGTGDVLTGLMVGFLAQGLPPFAAAQVGVWLHAKAADRKVRHTGSRSLLASDLADEVCQLLKRFE